MAVGVTLPYRTYHRIQTRDPDAIQVNICISTSEIDSIGETLNCNEQRNSLKECATECYNRSSTNTGCPGFYTDTTQNDVCHLCHAATSSEPNTSFNSDDILYLLTTRRVVPEVSIDFDNYTSDTIYGTGTEGTIIGLAGSDHVTGVKGKGLYVHGGGKVRITGSGTECWTTLDLCSSGMTASSWFKPTSLVISVIISTGNGNQDGFIFFSRSTGKMEFFIRQDSRRLKSITSTHVVMLNEWSLLTDTYNGVDRVTGYFDSACATISMTTFCTNHVQLVKARQRSCGNDNVFSRVCLSFCPKMMPWTTVYRASTN